MDREEVRAGRVDTAEDQMGTDVSLIPDLISSGEMIFPGQ